MPAYADPREWLPPSPVRFLVRLAFLSLVGTWLTIALSPTVVPMLLPLVKAEITTLDDNLKILSLELVPERQRNTLRLRANLNRPAHLETRSIDPLAHGWYQIDLNALALFQPPLVFCVLLLAWPHKTTREFAGRLLIALPLIVVLFAIDKPLELLGNFQQEVRKLANSGEAAKFFVWGKFLEGGGAAVLALAFAAAAISIAERARHRPSATLDPISPTQAAIK